MDWLIHIEEDIFFSTLYFNADQYQAGSAIIFH